MCSTMARTGSLCLKDAARELAGNWRRWDSFAWSGHHKLPDPDCRTVRGMS